MSDAAPWEDYAAPTAPAAQSVAEETGPWKDYAPAYSGPDPNASTQRYNPMSMQAEQVPAWQAAGFPSADDFKTAHTEGVSGAFKRIGGAAVGGAELGAQAVTGGAAQLAGGLGYLGTLGLTFDTDAAKAVQQDVADKLTYSPQLSQEGRENAAGINEGMQRTVGRATDYLSDKAADIGGPLAGAATRTVIEGAPYMLGARPVMGAARGVVGAAERLPGAAARAAQAPAGVAYDTSGNAIASGNPLPKYDTAGNAIAPALAANAENALPDTRGALAANPPKFEAAPPVTAVDSSVTSPPLPADVQGQRAATLKAAGLHEARDSAVTGDKKAAASDYQQSKLDNDGGQVLSNAFENERTALTNHTDALIADAGGSTGLDETSLHNRGQTILQPLQDLSDHLDGKIKSLYAQADATAGGTPLELKSTAATLANKPEFIGTTEGQQLLRGANAYLRQAGIADEAGTVGNATVQQAERFKQYLNNQWSPRTSRLIRGLKDSIDDDVTSSAGGDVYNQARAARRLRATMLDDPQGVSSLLENSGPNGINRVVNVERVPDAIARMPVDQFGHIVKTLSDVPAELKPQAQAALGEIRAQFALRLQEQAGKFKDQWNNRGVTQYLNNNSAKMAKVFTPSELQRLKTLNDAGNILDVNRAYPGAAVQGHNLVARGAIAGVQHGATALGAHIGGPIGAMAGEAAGGMAAKALGGSISKRAARARIRKLS